MPENEIDPTLQFNAGLDRNKKLYRDRFVFPEVLVVLFKNGNDEIIEKIEEEVEKRIRDGVAKFYSDEKVAKNIDKIILKNILGPFYDDLNSKELEVLLSIVGEIKDKGIKRDQEKSLSYTPKRKSILGDDLQKAVFGAKEFLNGEAKRAGFTSKVSRDSITGKLDLEGDAESLDGRIIFDEDSNDLEK